MLPYVAAAAGRTFGFILHPNLLCEPDKSFISFKHEEELVTMKLAFLFLLNYYF